MKIDFSALPQQKIDGFKGGEGLFEPRMFTDRANKIMTATLAPGAYIGMHTHEGTSEIVYILEGEGVMVCDGKREILRAGDASYCPEGHIHSLRNESAAPLRFFAVVPDHRAANAELWDAFDVDFNKVENAVLVRGEAIPCGLYHLVSDILVRHTDGTYLLMLRDVRKHFGDMWEATAGGSAFRGETPYECAARELREETGIVPVALTEIGRVTSSDTHYVEFLCVTDCDKDSVRLQPGETAGYRWVSASELTDMNSDELVTTRIQNFIDELRKA